MLGTPLAARGAQKPGPRVFLFSLGLDACVVMSLHVWILQYVGDKIFWSIKFGFDTSSTLFFCKAETCKANTLACSSSLAGQHPECRSELERSLPESVCDIWICVVKHVSKTMWQKECESILKCVTHNWLGVVTSFNNSTAVWRRRECKISALSGRFRSKAPATLRNCGRAVEDLFRGKTPTTPLKRARVVENFCGSFGVGAFPTSEQQIYPFLQYGRSKSDPPSKLKSYLETLAFCVYAFSMSGLKDVMTSKRLHGCTFPTVPICAIQAGPLTVGELTRLHELLHNQCDWNSAFAGAVLLAVYSRACWADATRGHGLLPDLDEPGITSCLDTPLAVKIFMHASIYRHKMLPLVAPGAGVAKIPWVDSDRWMEVRNFLGALVPPKHESVQAPSEGGQPTQRPLVATEAGVWFGKLLFDSKEQLERKRCSAHSMKVATLPFAATYGGDAVTRLQLAYHVGRLKMLHTHRRDAAAQPLLEFKKTVKATGKGRFVPDSTRNGRFMQKSVDTHTCKGMEVVVLTRPKRKKPPSSTRYSRSSDESEEVLPASSGRIFGPPVALGGYTF